ncbi:GNAT family protein [Bacillus nakamurai]|uniref:GNAT family N-acetyltransferase n=1 Tax=Bacillus nakamurai TaxID=1793963 RepID=UPI001E57C473|nr:GNAT family protein [Bacillus nakamurai]MED1229190.1 GNAT family protein [Bacillus nakamurai]
MFMLRFQTVSKKRSGILIVLLQPILKAVHSHLQCATSKQTVLSEAQEFMISRCSLGRRVLRPLLHQRSNPPTAVEIGSTWYASSVQRTGVHTECKLLVLTHAFEMWNAVRVTLKTDARNQRSRSGIQRIGAQLQESAEHIFRLLTAA